MTVSSSTAKVIHNGNGASGVSGSPWPFSFKVYDVAHLRLIYTDAAGLETVLSSGYSISLNADQVASPGGSVTYPTVGSPIASGTKFTIARMAPYVQLTDLQNQGGYFPEVLERQLDLLEMQIQQVNETLGRTVRAPESDAAIAAMPGLAQRSNRLLGFDALGMPAAYPLVSGVTGAGSINFLQAGAAAQSRTVQSLLCETIRVMDFGEVADGGDITLSLQRAINAAPATGAHILIPWGIYLISAEIIGKSHITIIGQGGMPGLGFLGTMLRRAPAYTSGPMFTFPGGTTSFPVGTGLCWGFRDIGLDGNDANAPIINAPENIRGSWNVQFERVYFLKGRPAIYAECAWEWYLTRCGFDLCGNMATGSGAQRAVIFIFNSNQVYGGANSNVWQFDRCYIDCRSGVGIWSDSGGAGQCNQNMILGHCHFGPTPLLGPGYANIYGHFGESIFGPSTTEGVSAGNVVIDLKARSGSGRNIISGWTMEMVAGNLGAYHVRTENFDDHIAQSTFVGQGSSGYHIHLAPGASDCTVSSNKARDSGGIHTVPLVNDQGTNSTIMWNDGSQGTVASNAMPIKWRGVTYQMAAMTGAAGVVRWTGTGFAAQAAPAGTNLPSVVLSASNKAGTPTIQRSVNVSSITDNGVGDFTIVPVTATASSEAAVLSGGLRFTGTDGGNQMLVGRNFNRVQSTTAIQVWVGRADGTAIDADRWSAAVIDGA